MGEDNSTESMPAELADRSEHNLEKTTSMSLGGAHSNANGDDVTTSNGGGASTLQQPVQVDPNSKAVHDVVNSEVRARFELPIGKVKKTHAAYRLEYQHCSTG